MSFILEALKKADAERDRGAVPDLYAQGMLPEAAFEGDTVARGRPWLWLLAGAGLALVAGIAWQWMGSDAPAAEPVVATSAALPPPSTNAVPNASDRATAVRQDGAGAVAHAPAHDGAPVSPVEPAEKRGAQPHDGADAGAAPSAQAVAPHKDAAKPSAEARPGAVANGEAKGAGKGVAKGAAKGEAKDEAKGDARHEADADAGAAHASARSTTASASKPPAPAAAAPVPLLAELPDDVRRQVPALKLGGLVYSAAPSARMLIVNGDLQREGSTIAPGLKLEHIKPKSAVFSIRGQAFEVEL